MFNFNAFPITLMNLPKSSERTGYLSDSARITNFQSKYSVGPWISRVEEKFLRWIIGDMRLEHQRSTDVVKQIKKKKRLMTITRSRERERRKAKLQKETENDLKHIN